ncbi:DNA-binding transcriptional LysR family regulator [Azospirillum agricola]|uniref:LysR family transcriptional regulator n=1 Tax=Azospirillum agricola TaxID=1720247 RepID=UPI001AE612DF|nr:LysR family transcriptional regulator [Azospirillum agricola]MBP2226809.1 DNA-binding transcriptional LysR family regulator [Azospirillum agricola]
MKLNEIRTFVTVAEAQSVQEAGNRLGLTQSAVSRLIQRLEAELGVTLFDRQTKPLALTRDGEVALAHARRILGAATDFSDAFAGSVEPRGLLRLGVSHVLVPLAAGRPLDELRAAFPGLTVRIHSDWSAPLTEQVRTGVLDGAVMLLGDGQAPPEDLPARRLSREEVSVIASAEQAAAGPWSLSDMNAAGWVLQPDGCKYRNALGLALAPLGARPNVMVEAFDQTLLVSLVARGVGFGLAPLRLIAPVDAAAALRIRPVTVPDFRFGVAVWLVRARVTGRIGPVFDRLEDSLTRQLTASPAGVHSAAE